MRVPETNWLGASITKSAETAATLIFELVRTVCARHSISTICHSNLFSEIHSQINLINPRATTHIREDIVIVSTMQEIALIVP